MDPVKFDHGINTYSLTAEVKPCRVPPAEPKGYVIELFDSKEFLIKSIAARNGLDQRLHKSCHI